LPWGAPLHYAHDSNEFSPGEFALRTLFTEFTIMAAKKIDSVAAEALVSPKYNNKWCALRSQFDEVPALAMIKCI
jgi:hypothetical protein